MSRPKSNVPRSSVAFAALLPDDEQRRAGPVLPAQHVGGAERAVVEVGVAGVVVRRVAVRRSDAARPSTSSLKSRVVAGRHERLRVDLERQARRHRVVDARRQRRPSSDRGGRTRSGRRRRPRPTATRSWLVLMLRPALTERNDDGRNVTLGAEVAERRALAVVADVEEVDAGADAAALVARRGTPRCCAARCGTRPGPPRVARSSNGCALTLTPDAGAQLFVNIACALTLPPEIEPIAAEVPARPLIEVEAEAAQVLRTACRCATASSCSSSRWSARRRKPTSLMSKPGS